MRFVAAKIDVNQPEIVDALRKAGCTVQHLHMVGSGCPDILVGHMGKNYLIEIKSGGGKLTKHEKAFHTTWMGQVSIARNADEALAIIGAIEVSRK